MVTSGLVAHWPLHEWAGRASDISGNGNHGTINGGVAQGVAGVGALTATEFDGSDDYIATSFDFASLNGDRTVFLWMNSNDDDTPSQYMFGTNEQSTGQAGLRYYGDTNNVQFHTYDGTTFASADTPNVLPDHKCIHIGRCYRDSTYYIYVNGDVNVGDSDAWLYDSTGEDISGSNRPFNGGIADVRVYNRALSQSEIDYLYRAGSVDVATPPGADDASAVARYSFDDRSDTSTALDEWGSNSGAITGATYSADGIRGLAMDFDGSNDNITVTNDSSLNFGTGPFTISFWANPDQLSSAAGEDKRVIWKRDGAPTGYQMDFTDPNDLMRITIYDSTGSSVNATSSENHKTAWQHVVGMRDTSTGELKLFVNGVLDATADSSSIGDIDTTIDLYLGSLDGGGQHFDGTVDDIRFYDRALSDEEIQQLYQFGTRGTDRRYEVLRQ
jgi:hypothetical protein